MLVIRCPFSFWQKGGSCTSEHHGTMINDKLVWVLENGEWRKDTPVHWFLKCQFPNCSAQCCTICAESLDSCRKCALPFCHSHRNLHDCQVEDARILKCASCASGKQLLGNEHACERCRRAQCTDERCETSITTCMICNRDVCGFCRRRPLFLRPTMSICYDCEAQHRRRKMSAESGAEPKYARSF